MPLGQKVGPVFFPKEEKTFRSRRERRFWPVPRRGTKHCCRAGTRNGPFFRPNKEQGFESNAYRLNLNAYRDE